MRRYWFPKPYADTVARLRVPGGFLLVAAFALLSRPDAASLSMGLPVSVVGLLLRAWAAGHLAKNQQLAASGPYAYVRNPLYIGTLIVALGLIIAAREPLVGMIFLAVFVLIYLPVIELEEQHLRKLFPEYEAYAASVPMLRPRLIPVSSPPRAFSWRLYTKNQEYQALLGFLAGAVLLFWKAFT
jgi:protein-S-isoprenylcysteine O-methyltransferase Ste14